LRNKNLFESFFHAFEGLSHVLWTQKHVRSQLFMVILVFMLSFTVHLSTLEFLFVLSAVCLVMLAELFNTAIEVVVNMITLEYHPLAKIAKDVAAAGVLMASFYAVIVGGGIFFYSNQRLPTLLHSKQSLPHALTTMLIHLEHIKIAHPSSVVIIFLCFSVLSILVALGKSQKNHGSILQGGAVSGHTAVAFMLCTAIILYSDFNLTISIFAVVLALLVAQSRVEGKIHTLTEVLWGAVFAIILMTIIVLCSH
jgi:diacylglycerol kinase (ATP)